MPPSVSLSISAAVTPTPGRFDKLVNAMLRRVDREGREALAQLEAGREDLPSWIWTRWESIYGPDLARRIATASLTEADLDLSVQSDANGWAVKLGGTVLSTGSVRLKAGGRIEDLPGYADGAWWVQDAAAALPVKLLGSVAGKNVADLCAAPGGKTAELAAAGANVTSVEQSARRMGRLKANLERLKLTAELVEADATAWNPGRTFEAVLVDAPCTATGTIRRHPDILHLKREGDIAALAAIQQRLLDHAATLVAQKGFSSTAPARWSRKKASSASRLSSWRIPNSQGCRSLLRKSVARPNGSPAKVTCERCRSTRLRLQHRKRSKALAWTAFSHPG